MIVDNDVHIRRRPAMAETTTRKSAARKARGSSEGFTAEERAAIKETVKERRRAASGSKVDGEQDLLTKIAEMDPKDRDLAEHVHKLIKEVAPDLTCRTWYGMPAYSKNGDVLCFFQSAGKFKARYAMLGFSDKAALDDGALWPVYYAVAEWTAAVDKQLRAVIGKAVG
jgi:uncharacterized protein YdhG (YjbR/CyaY superfamily)